MKVELDLQLVADLMHSADGNMLIHAASLRVVRTLVALAKEQCEAESARCLSAPADTARRLQELAQSLGIVVSWADVALDSHDAQLAMESPMTGPEFLEAGRELGDAWRVAR